MFTLSPQCKYWVNLHKERNPNSSLRVKYARNSKQCYVNFIKKGGGGRTTPILHFAQLWTIEVSKIKNHYYFVHEINRGGGGNRDSRKKCKNSKWIIDRWKSLNHRTCKIQCSGSTYNAIDRWEKEQISSSYWEYSHHAPRPASNLSIR